MQSGHSGCAAFPTVPFNMAFMEDVASNFSITITTAIRIGTAKNTPSTRDNLCAKDL